MKQHLRIGTRVRIGKLPDNVTDEVKHYEGETGLIKCYGSPSDTGEHGYYILMDNGMPAKRFYENELRIN